MAKCEFYRIAEGRSFRYDPVTDVPVPYQFTYGVCVKERECDTCYCDGDKYRCDYEENEHDCCDCRFFDEPDAVCRLKDCHRAFTRYELKNKDFVTDAWEKK